MSMIKSFLLSLIIFAIGFVPADARDLSNIDLSVLNNLQNIGSDSIGKQYDSTKVGVQETYQNANKENLEEDNTFYDMAGLEALTAAATRGETIPEFKKVCKESNQSGNMRCLDVFKNVQVQPHTGVGLAKEYVKEKYNQIIQCSPEMRTETVFSFKENYKDDFLACTSTDGGTFYEFRFDDLRETNANKIHKGILTGLATTFNAQNVFSYVTSVRNKPVTKYSDCETMPLDKFEISYIYKSKGPFLSTAPQKPYCELDKKYGAPLHNDLGKLVDNTVFKNLQTRLNFDLEAMLASYTIRELAKNNITTADRFWCNHNSRPGPKSGAMEATDVIACYIHIDQETYTTNSGTTYKMPQAYSYQNSVDKIYKIEFIFEDLDESWDTFDEGAHSAMSCISKTDGVYDGKHCNGITYQQCKMLGEDVEWREDIGGGTCTLKAANTVANIQRVGEIAKNTGIATAVVVLTVATGGGTIYVVLAVGGALAAIGQDVVTDLERGKTDEFIASLANCDSRECVRDHINLFLDKYSNYIDNLTDDQVKAIDDAMAKGLEKFPEENPDDDEALFKAIVKAKDKNWWEKCKSDALQGSKCILDVSAVLFDFLPVGRLAVKAAQQTPVAAAFGTKFAKKMPRAATVLTAKVQKLSKNKNLIRLSNVTDKTAMAVDIEGLSSGTSNDIQKLLGNITFK